MHSSTLSLTSVLDGIGWSTPRPGRFTPGKETPCPSYRRVGEPQGRSGRVRKISPPPGLAAPNRPARSELLYRLSYPGPRSCASILCVYLRGVDKENVTFCLFT